MISTLIAFALMAGGNELVCPIMGEAANMAGPKVEYNGAMFAFCCGGCDSTFSKDPVAAFKNPKTKGKAIGMYLFDPVRERESAAGRSAVPAARVRSSGGLRGSLGASGSFFDADTFDSRASPSSSGHATNYSFLFQGIDQLRQICRDRQESG